MASLPQPRLQRTGGDLGHTDSNFPHGTLTAVTAAATSPPVLQQTQGGGAGGLMGLFATVPASQRGDCSAIKGLRAADKSDNLAILQGEGRLRTASVPIPSTQGTEQFDERLQTEEAPPTQRMDVGDESMEVMEGPEGSGGGGTEIVGEGEGGDVREALENLAKLLD